MNSSSTSSRFRATGAATAIVLALAGSAGVAQASIVFRPLYPGEHATGSGSDAHFVQVDPQWKGSTVVWKDPDPIGSYAWGTGLWGRADWQFAQSLSSGSPLVGNWSGLAPTINYGNGCYNAVHSGLWGAATLLAFDADPDCDASPGNWAARFSGYIRIAEAGDYNFSVLFDDGFFLRLVGEGGQALEIGRDYLNPRERVGFGEDLAMVAGLYAFELGAWNRLQAGVVDLRWTRGGGEDWTLVPTENLLPGSAVPEPATIWLLALGLAAWGGARRRSSQGGARR